MDIRSGTELEGPDGQLMTVESVLGSGGFGQVFCARFPSGEKVAVKTVLTSLLDESELAVFLNEIALAVGLNHPNVVRVLHVNDGRSGTGNPPYMVMELVAGGTLREAMQSRIDGGNPFTPEELRTMYLELAEGMSAVNAVLVHRDLKPENVLIAADTGALKIADFGLAKAANALTRSNTFKGWGTQPYQAPEAFEMGPNTPAMDMYAAGVVFYELAALTLPVRPRDEDHRPLAWRDAHLLIPPKDIRGLRPDLPLDLAQLIMQMLQKNRAKRPASWADVIARLQRGDAPSGAPDVAALVQRATTFYVNQAAQETAAREAEEARTQRRALLSQAFAEPINVLQTLVEAFNSASDLVKLKIEVGHGTTSAVVRSPSGRSVHLNGSIIDDVDLKTDGVLRIVGTVRLDPCPTLSSIKVAVDRESFGSFNLVYRVRRDAERFGDWTQFRFECNPLLPMGSFPRWFGLDLNEVPRQMGLLHAMGLYQHEHRILDDEWMKALLAQLL